MTRYERKFILTLEDYEVIKERAFFMGAIDPHAKKENRYPVFTRYYDSEQKEFFTQKIEGEFSHLKIRERVYATCWQKGAGRFLEAKIKTRDEQKKIRIPYDEQKGYTSSPYFNYFQNILSKKNLSLTCNIYYEREAYLIPTLWGEVKINFDHHICALLPSELIMTKKLLSKRCLDEGRHILMEIKHRNNQLPEVITAMLKRLDTKMVSFSKYAWGLEYLENLEENNNL